MVQDACIFKPKVQIMKLRDKILELRNLGYSYRKIEEKIKCSKGTISYYCGKGQKEKNKNRRKKNRFKQHPIIQKIENFIYNKYKDPKNVNYRKNTLNRNLSLKIQVFSRVKKGYKNMAFTVKDFLDKVGDNPKCSLTGKPIDLMKPRTYQLDHIVPKSKGGENNLDNCQLVCKEANMAKHNLSTEEFVKLCREVVEYHNRNKL